MPQNHIGTGNISRATNLNDVRIIEGIWSPMEQYHHLIMGKGEGPLAVESGNSFLAPNII